jgi:hypothetical protein
MASLRTAAVSFPNGSIINIGRVKGSSSYEEAIRRLSLVSSSHLQSGHLLSALHGMIDINQAE